MTIGSFQKRLIYLLFAISGFSALIYEILWTKYLSLSFGTTMIAVSIVAATFMGGLALGSYLLGRYADRHSNLLRLYAFLEVGIALFALLFPPTLEIVVQIHTWMETTTLNHPAWTHGIHFLFSAILLAPPTILMGGTFPLMCRFFARRKSGGQIGRLYALNTLGATAGAFSCGYLLIPSIGLSATGYIAIFLNLLIAVVFYRLSLQPESKTGLRDVSSATRPEQPILVSQHRPWLIAVGLIGFFSLAYEILWTRVFLLFLGNTTYAFAIMLSTFLVGIGIGGAIYARMARPELNEKKAFVLLSALMGAAVLVTVPFYDKLPYLFQFAHEVSGERWWHLSLLSCLIVFLVMFVPTVLSGALLPAAVAILDPGKSRTGEGVGLVVLFNTCGAVLGSLTAGFILIPLIGLQLSFQMLAASNLLMALFLLFSMQGYTGVQMGKALPISLTMAMALVLMPAEWDQKLMNSAVYCYAPKYEKWGGIDQTLQGERVLEVIEDIDTTVAVKEYADGSVRYFSVNGKTDGGTGTDMSTQVLIGQLPLMLHPDPHEALVIGLGTGITLGGVAQHPLQCLDCVEISPGVVEAAKYFVKENHRVLEDPAVNLFIEDGRNLLLTNKKRYDVIISEPSNPWQVGNANIFTSEFYELANKRLKDDGIFCQWIGLYDITPENLRVAVNTFLQAFPQVLAFNSKTDMILIGRNRELELDLARIDRALARPQLRSVFDQIGISDSTDLIARHYLFSESTLRNFSKGAAINSDDHPILEYSFRHLLGDKILGTLFKQNATAMFSAKAEESIPLVNLGDSQKERLQRLKSLRDAFNRFGRKAEAGNLLQRAYETDVTLQMTPSPERPFGG